jgi:hypothetical protein
MAIHDRVGGESSNVRIAIVVVLLELPVQD